MGGDEILILRKENNMLRMEIEELRKKNDGMLATNRFLLEENATIRIKSMAAGSGGGGGGGNSGGGGGYPSYGGGGGGSASGNGQGYNQYYSGPSGSSSGYNTSNF